MIRWRGRELGFLNQACLHGGGSANPTKIWNANVGWTQHFGKINFEVNI